MWYPRVYGAVSQKNASTKRPRLKKIPVQIEEFRTPFSLAIWVMDDGSGMRKGGFKLATHGFDKSESLFLCDLLQKKYGLTATVIKDGKGRYTIRVWKRSVPTFKERVSPFLCSSYDYKFRFVEQ